MSSPIVQVLFQGRLLQCIPFEGEELRIGRRKDNDIVISNLSVSRRHAKLVRDDGSIFLHDAGSENGCFLNGARVEKTKKVEIGLDDELVIGKHRILIQWEAAAPSASPYDSQTDLAKTRAIPVPVPQEGIDSPSEQWRAAVDAPASERAPELAPAEPTDEEFEIAIDFGADEFEVSIASQDAAPADEGADLPSFEESVATPEIEPPSDSGFFEKAEVPAPSEPEPQPEKPRSEPVPQPPMSEVEAANPDESGLFGSDPVKGPGTQAPKQAHSNPELDLRDFDFDLESAKAPKREPSPTVAMPVAVPDGSETQGRPVALPEGNLNETQVVPQFPMLSIRNGEDAVRTVRWESSRLEVGRSSDCDIVLADPRVSRKHAEFEADAEGYRVRDLESINFTFVNGEKITDRTLAPGDVVRIENFEITFEMNGLAETDGHPEPKAAVNRSTNSMTMIKPLAREFDGPSAPLGEFDSDAAALTDPGNDISTDELAIGGELESQLDSLSQGSFEDAEAAPRDVLSEVEAELELEMGDEDHASELFAGPSDSGDELAAEVEDSPTVPPITHEPEHQEVPEAVSETPEIEVTSPVTDGPGSSQAEEADPIAEADVELSHEAPAALEIAPTAEADEVVVETPEMEIPAPQRLDREDTPEVEVDPGSDPESVLSPTDPHGPADDDTNAELLLASVVDEPVDEVDRENVLSDEPEGDPLAAALIEAADSIPDLAEAPDEDEPFSLEAPAEDEPLSLEAPAEDEPLSLEAPAEDEPISLGAPAEDEPLSLEAPAEDEPLALEPQQGSVDELFEAPGQVTELAQEEDPPSLALEEPIGAQTQLYDPLDHPETLSESDEREGEDGSLPPSPLAEIGDAAGGRGGVDSLFDAGIEEAHAELDEDKPLEESPAGRSSDMESAVSFRADPSQVSMPTGKLSIEFALRVEDLSEPVRAILRESREKGLVLPIEIRVKVED